MAKYWMKKIKTKKGALSRQLGVPEKENLPVSFLNRISSTKVGRIARNPTGKGFKKVKVTRLLKKRAVLARTFKRIR